MNADQALGGILWLASDDAAAQLTAAQRLDRIRELAAAAMPGEEADR